MPNRPLTNASAPANRRMRSVSAAPSNSSPPISRTSWGATTSPPAASGSAERNEQVGRRIDRAPRKLAALVQVARQQREDRRHHDRRQHAEQLDDPVAERIEAHLVVGPVERHDQRVGPEVDLADGERRAHRQRGHEQRTPHGPARGGAHAHQRARQPPRDEQGDERAHRRPWRPPRRSRDRAPPPRSARRSRRRARQRRRSPRDPSADAPGRPPRSRCSRGRARAAPPRSGSPHGPAACTAWQG